MSGSSGGGSPVETAPGPVVVAVPEDDDAAPLGVVHLRSWHETHVSPEHGVDAAWVDEHVGPFAFHDRVPTEELLRP